MQRSPDKALGILLLAYGVASLVHFSHNAEFLPDYPNLPPTWTRPEVYFAWSGMTVVGVCGWLCLARGFTWVGLVLLAIYAGLGLGSLGHYVLAPVSAHTRAMNWTILAEVGLAASVLVEVLRRLAQRLSRPRAHPP